MPWVVGIDEAGYGPNLGPLVQAAVALYLPDYDPAGWETLKPVVRRCGDKADERLLIDDSKKVYARGGLAALEQAVANRRALLILDNFEAFVPARSVLAAVSRRSRDLRILVTTRHRLGLATEWIINIDGLDYPPDAGDASGARAFPAVQLFEQVAVRLAASFDLGENLPAVVRICQLVDLAGNADTDRVADADLVGAEIDQAQADLDNLVDLHVSGERAAECRRHVRALPPTELR